MAVMVGSSGKRRRDLRPTHLSSRRRLAQDRKPVVPDLAGAQFTPAMFEAAAIPTVAAPENAAGLYAYPADTHATIVAGH